HAHTASPVCFRTTLGAFVGAIGANAVLPARVGEALRVGVVRRRVPNSSVVTLVSTIVLETGIEVVFGAAVIATALLAGRAFGSGTAVPGPPGLLPGPVVLGLVAAVLVVAGALAFVFRDRARSLAGRMAAGFAVMRSPRAFVGGVLVWKLVAWSLRFGSVYA